MPRIRNEEGLYIGSLYTSELQCFWPECESWHTLTLEVVGHHDGTPQVVYYSLCRVHLSDFIDKFVFGVDTNIILKADGTEE